MDKEPTKNIRITERSYRMLKIMAAEKGISLQELIEQLTISAFKDTENY